MDVGVRELKAHLSAYLERASGGEVIRVTDRGRPLAMLGPVPDTERLENGIRQGWIRAGSAGVAQPVARATSRKRIADVLGEDRDDR